MMHRSGFSKFLMALFGMLAFEAGCASHVTPPPVVQASPLTGRLTTAVIVAVRNIDPNVDLALTGSILTALGLKTVNSPEASAVEIVIQRSGQTGTSIVEPEPNGAPAYAPGERIAIVEAAETVIHPE